jgi:hypothetical protein
MASTASATLHQHPIYKLRSIEWKMPAGKKPVALELSGAGRRQLMDYVLGACHTTHTRWPILHSMLITSWRQIRPCSAAPWPTPPLWTFSMTTYAHSRPYTAKEKIQDTGCLEGLV